MFRFFIFLFLITTSNILSFAQNNWQLIKNEDNIRVYIKDNSTSDYKEVRIETVVSQNLSTIVRTLADVKAYTEWIYNCKKSYLVKRISNKEFFYYIETYVPWPLDNRDMVMHSVLSQDPETKIINVKINAENVFIAKKEDIVRIKHAHIHWKLIPKNNGDVQIIYYLRSNPGGDTPAWLINKTVDIGPFYSIEKLCHRLKLKKYHRKLDYILE